MPFDVDIWYSVAFRVLADRITAPWVVMSQWRGTEDAGDYASRSPVFDQYLAADGTAHGTFVIATRSDPNAITAGQRPEVVRFTDTSFELGRWYRMVYRIRLARTGDGEIQAWRDGVEIIPTTVGPIGYNDDLGPQFRFGAYRNPDGDEPITIEYANVEIGTTSLAARVASPLALPT